MGKKMGPLLLQAGLLTPKDLERIQEEARRRRVSLLDILLDEKKVSEENLADTMAKWLRLPRVHVASLTVEPNALSVISQELARKHTCLPVKLEGKSLVLAMANPADFEAVQALEFSSGLSIRPVVASRTEILDGIGTHYAPDEQLQDFLANVSESSEFNIMPDEEEGNGDVNLDASRNAAEQAPVVKMCNLIIQDAVRAGASDIHVEAELNSIRVRLRVDGVLRDYMQVPAAPQPAGLAHEDSRQARHLRAPPAAGRPHQNSAPGEVHRPARLHAADALRRKGGAAAAGLLQHSRTGAVGLHRAAGRHPRCRAGPAAGDDPDDRSDRLGQEHHALFLPGAAPVSGSEHHHG
jgi:hypothetical protein